MATKQLNYLSFIYEVNEIRFFFNWIVSFLWKNSIKLRLTKKIVTTPQLEFDTFHIWDIYLKTIQSEL